MGIDPGTLIMGYGIIDSEADRPAMIGCGALKCSTRSPIGERLNYLYRELLKVIGQYRPEVVAVEQPFVARNVKSAMAVGRAQAVAILAAAGQGLPVYEYTPTQVKQRVADYGAGGKEQVQEMVRIQLGLAEPPQPHDAADALAVAMCHLQEIHLENLLSRGKS
jgi:crossover junction endodeoxyribonuclease RuvC